MALRRFLGFSDGELMRSDAKPCSQLMKQTAGLCTVGGGLGFWILCRLHYGLLSMRVKLTKYEGILNVRHKPHWAWDVVVLLGRRTAGGVVAERARQGGAEGVLNARHEPCWPRDVVVLLVGRVVRRRNMRDGVGFRSIS